MPDGTTGSFQQAGSSCGAKTCEQGNCRACRANRHIAENSCSWCDLFLERGEGHRLALAGGNLAFCGTANHSLCRHLYFEAKALPRLYDQRDAIFGEG